MGGQRRNSGKEVIRNGNYIIGFIEQQKDGTWGYAFGKPSQKSYLMFYVDTKEEAQNRVLEASQIF